MSTVAGRPARPGTGCPQFLPVCVDAGTGKFCKNGFVATRICESGEVCEVAGDDIACKRHETCDPSAFVPECRSNIARNCGQDRVVKEEDCTEPDLGGYCTIDEGEAVCKLGF